MNKDVISKVLATVIAAGIIANIAALFDLSKRLARIETKLEIMERTNLAQK